MTRRGPGRPPTTGPGARILVVVPHELRARLEAVCDPGEPLSAVIRAGLVAEIERREEDRR